MRAELHRDAAAHERAGAALERRWVDVIASEAASTEVSDGQERVERDAAAQSQKADVEAREVEMKLLETQLDVEEADRARPHLAG